MLSFPEFMKSLIDCSSDAFSTAMRISKLFLVSANATENRSRERYRRAALTGLTASISKIVSLGTSFLTVRLTFRYLGAERYGMWMTITSVVLMLGFADFGMSNGLINLVAGALGNDDKRRAKEAVASAFWMLSAIAIVGGIAALAFYPLLNSRRIFNVDSPTAVHEAGPVLLVILFCFFLNLPLGAVRGTQTGMQNAFVTNLWSILGTVLSLIALMAAIHLHAGLPILAFCLSGPPILALVFNCIELFGFSHPELLPSLSAFSSKSLSLLLRTGMMFFLLQLGFTIGMQTDNIVIAQILGASSVADYAVQFRLFSFVNALLIVASGSMWPAYADAMARSDGDWIRRSFLRVTLYGMAITAAASLILVSTGNRILALWVGPQMHASAALLIILGVQCIIYAYLQPINFLLNGIGKFKVQVQCAIGMAVLNLALSIFLVRHYGIIGAVLGTIVSQLIVQVIPLTIVSMRALQELDRANANKVAVP